MASLCNIKNDKALETPKADMWCHFGKITIWAPQQGIVDLGCKCVVWCQEISLSVRQLSTAYGVLVERLCS